MNVMDSKSKLLRPIFFTGEILENQRSPKKKPTQAPSQSPKKSCTGLLSRVSKFIHDLRRGQLFFNFFWLLALRFI